MPRVPIIEMFRSFNAPIGSVWKAPYLEPDLSAYGLFKDENAALFVEYDGHSDHLTPVGIERDVRKNAALLDFAPTGSFVVRIGRTGRRE